MFFRDGQSIKEKHFLPSNFLSLAILFLQIRIIFSLSEHLSTTRKSTLKILFRVGTFAYYKEYIFLRLDKVCPWEGTEMKTDFFFREKVFLSEIVGKKDGLSNRAEQLSTRAKRG